MTIKEYTTYQQLEIPVYDVPGWHQYIDRNFHAIDGYMYLLTGVTNIRGVWKNNTVYHVADHLVDHVDGTVYKCLVQHTSPATGTFQAYRTANPGHWQGPLDVFQGSSTTTRFEFLNTDDAITVSDAAVEIRGGLAVAKRILTGSYVSIASTDGYAFSVGRLNRVNPGFAVNTSNVTSETGVLVSSKPAGGGVDIQVISPSANEILRIDAKGTGAIVIGSVSTGPVGISRPVDITAAVVITTTAGGAFMVGAGVDKTFQVNTVNSPAGGGIIVFGTPGAGNGGTIVALGTTADERLVIQAKGAGALHIDGTPLYMNNSTTANIVCYGMLDVRKQIVSTNSANGSIVVVGIGGIGVGGDINAGGTIKAIGNIATEGFFVIDGTTVVKNQVPGWGTPTTTVDRTTFDNAATLPDVAKRLGTLINDLRGHGLIGT